MARGASVYPFAFDDERGAQAAASRLGAVLARPRRLAAGGFSLSPASLTGIASGTKLMLPSPNGSRLSVAAGNTPERLPVITGCLRNASAVARHARVLAGQRAVGVIPAGEH